MAVEGSFDPATRLPRLMAGSAILFITDVRTGELAMYYAKGVADNNRLVAIRLTKAGDDSPEPHEHQVTLAGAKAACDCQDATYRPDRPGGCRHLNALTQALGRLANSPEPIREPMPF